MTAIVRLRILLKKQLTPSAVLAFFMLGLLLGYGHWLCQTFLINVDLAALLGLARHYDLSAYHYGREVWEINPPLILLILKLPIALEKISEMPAYWWATQLVMFLIWGCGLALQKAITQAKIEMAGLRSAVMSWLCVLLWCVLAAGDVTEREMIVGAAITPLFVLLLPVLFERKVQAISPVMPVWEKMLWVVAAVCSLIKPQYYVLLCAFIVGLFIVQRSYILKNICVFIGIGLVGAAYSFVLVQSGWLEFYWYTKNAYASVGMPKQQVLSVLLWQGLIAIMAVCALLCLRRFNGRMVIGFGVFMVALWTAALLQQKAFIYHFLPITMLLCVFLAWVVSSVLRHQHTEKTMALAAVISVVVMMALMLQGSFALWHKELKGRQLDLALSGEVAQVLSQYPSAPVLILSSDMTDAISLAEMTGHPLALRMPHLWPLLAEDVKYMSGQMTLTELAERMKVYGQMAVQDIRRSQIQYGQPPLILQRVIGPQVEQGEEANYVALFSRHEAFAQELKRYARPRTTKDRPGAGLKTTSKEDSGLGVWLVYVTSSRP